MDFCLVLDRKYCDNSVLLGEDIIGEDGCYVYPREQQCRISNMFEVNTGLLDGICILDDEEEVVIKYADVILFSAKILPNKKAKDLKDSEINNLLKSILVEIFFPILKN